jgi:hypothetical protein
MRKFIIISAIIVAIATLAGCVTLRFGNPDREHPMSIRERL